MATRIKTIEVVVQTVATTLAAATKRTLSGTIYIPETIVAFRSVTAEFSFLDDVTSAGSPTSISMGIKLGAAGEDTSTISDTFGNSGESMAYRVSRDCTAYFTTNWSGTSMTFEANPTIAVNATANHTAKLRITYEYDDSSSTHIKTIWIPIESTRSVLTTSYQSVGGTTGLPALKGGSTILPEASVTIRQIWVELKCGDANAGTTDFSLDVRTGTDLEETLTLYRVEAALATPNPCHAIWDITALGLTAGQALEAQATGVTDRFFRIGGWVAVTYEFSPGTSTTIWNSLVLGLEGGETDQRGTSTAVAHLVTDLMIEEPTTITTKTSAFVGCCPPIGSAQTLNIRCDPASSFTSYASADAGSPVHVVHRLDSGGAAGGAGPALARGRNPLRVRWYTGTALSHTGFGGYLIVNYTSGKASGGVGSHNHSVHSSVKFGSGDFTDNSNTVAKVPFIPETAYYIQAIAVQGQYLSTNLANSTTVWAVSYTTGEGIDNLGVGGVPVYTAARWHASAENWCAEVWGVLPMRYVKQWATHPDSQRLNIETSRSWRLQDPDSVWLIMGQWYTYHSITFAKAGTVSGYTGDGSGITVRLVDDTTGQRLVVGSTSAGGTYSLDWYDDTENVFVEARQSASKVGRSERGTA